MREAKRVIYATVAPLECYSREKVESLAKRCLNDPDETDNGWTLATDSQTLTVSDPMGTDVVVWQSHFPARNWETLREAYRDAIAEYRKLLTCEPPTAKSEAYQAVFRIRNNLKAIFPCCPHSAITSEAKSISAEELLNELERQRQFNLGLLKDDDESKIARRLWREIGASISRLRGQRFRVHSTSRHFLLFPLLDAWLSRL